MAYMTYTACSKRKRARERERERERKTGDRKTARDRQRDTATDREAYLHDPRFLFEVNIRGEVHVPGEVIVKDLNQIPRRRHRVLEPRGLGHVVHHGGEETALYALHGPHLFVEVGDLVGTERYPLPDDHTHVVRLDDLVQVVAHVVVLVLRVFDELDRLGLKVAVSREVGGCGVCVWVCVCVCEQERS
jgi:hypothetical protein